MESKRKYVDVEDLYHALYDEDAITMRGASIIKSFPTVEAVELYCEDCEHWNENNKGTGYDFCKLNNCFMHKYDYCSKGKRKVK